MVIDELQKATRYTNLGVCGRPARGSCLIFTTVAVLKNTSDGSLYKSRCVCVYVRFLPGIHSSGSDGEHIWWFAVQIQVRGAHGVLTQYPQQW